MRERVCVYALHYHAAVILKIIWSFWKGHFHRTLRMYMCVVKDFSIVKACKSRKPE